ncbi:MAG: type II toxin-antitoxin system death-on-curing family toxin [Candidatus Berkelbacteria bacterium]|nr:type II toxin-antitoxin system death-on-curing family toxin [Candidatus Berkelbacteria bacterium]MCR4308037.1 type II toxin-antitoxin system death-on-curing family toxin [Candidatus Berkelbacteria bacterium]
MPSPRSNDLPRYLTGEEVLYIHYQIIEHVGGSHGVRDMNLFLSTIERPQSAVFGEEQFSTIFEKAAVYLDSFARHQIFVDGNKRTAFTSAARFLFLNGFEFEANNEEAEMFVMAVANKKVAFDEIANWLEERSGQ